MTQPAPVAIVTFGINSKEGKRLLAAMLDDEDACYTPIDVRALMPNERSHSHKIEPMANADAESVQMAMLDDARPISQSMQSCC